MDFELNAIYSLTVGIGAVIGWIRVRKTDPAFLSFILLLTAGFFAELISIVVIAKGYSNAIYYNLFTLVEAMLITWLFYQWKMFTNKRLGYLCLQILYPVGWICEFIYRNNLTAFHSWFIIAYSTILVFLSINKLHGVLFKEPFQLYQNPVFLICMGVIIYFTYTILVEIFWFYGLNKSSVFRIRIYSLFSYINLFTNILFIIATLWIPMKRQYILRSSLAV